MLCYNVSHTTETLGAGAGAREGAREGAEVEAIDCHAVNNGSAI